MKKYLITAFMILLSSSVFANDIQCTGGDYIINISTIPTLVIELQDNGTGVDKEYSRKNINVKRGFETRYGLTSPYGSYYEIVLDDLSASRTLSGFILKVDGRKKNKTKITCN